MEKNKEKLIKSVVCDNENFELRLTYGEYKGRKRYSLRLWFWVKEMGEWRPTKKGLNMIPDEAKQFIKQDLIDTTIKGR